MPSVERIPTGPGSALRRYPRRPGWPWPRWQHPGGHRWRWEFQDNGDGTTDVTETFDYSWAQPVVGKAYELLRLDRENGNGIRASLTRLAGRYL